ncbi:putative hydroxymethylpyrimidine transport system substrate-binding protein [Paenibacillus sp. UNC496MF]|uniref:ABC transporter substrate-binding protein n=1 Tax=Paenibacillus sp. UNC496MF TaxID=1502753 RepID=UPI0008E54017|nr:ABC transporter substrate-binding protein [Paenibacillus sp. UNC496MF]SFJ22699.1 putative hydroxymethylpyrimidine transport system substrate-binding protein [Paenibacillus sp. UNC496MF]
MRKPLLFAFPMLIAAALLALGGCGSSPGGGAAPNAGNAVNAGAGEQAGGGAPTPKISLMLDWYPNAVHSFLYAAEAQGYFAKAGLDVDIRMPADTNDALKLVAAGKVDLALTYQPQVLMARGEHIPVKSIAAIVRHPLNHLMVPAGGGVRSPKDLAGKTIGFSSIPLYEAMARTMIKQDGGDPDAAKLVDVGYDLIPAISTGKVDAIIGGFINHEQLILDKDGHPVDSLDPAAYGVPDYYELVLAASDDGLKAKRELFAKFVRAAAEGQRYVEAHPDDALKTLLAHEDGGSPLDPAIEAKSLDILLPLMTDKDAPFGAQDPASWDRVNAWLADNGLLGSDVKAADAFVRLAD